MKMLNVSIKTFGLNFVLVCVKNHDSSLEFVHAPVYIRKDKSCDCHVAKWQDKLH